MKMQWKYALASAALMLLPCIAIGKPSDIDARIAAERAKAARIHRLLEAKRSRLHAITLHYNDLQALLHQTNLAIASVNARIGDLNASQAAIQRKIAWNTIQLGAAQRSLRLHDALLDRRLVDIYEHGDESYLNVLLSARSFSDFVERWEDLRLLIAADEEAIRQRKRAEERVAAIAAALQETNLELQQQQRQQEQARDQLGSLAAERQNLVALAASQRNAASQQVAEVEDLSAAEEAQLEALIREKERELQAERRASGIAGNEGRGAAGMFSWPVTGTITSPFGWRSNPFGGAPEFHQGLDIAVPIGTTVTAAASGTVIMAQWYGGYGNYILIDHGGGYSTGYGHLSAIYVSVGQRVARGQAIGASGSTGDSTGPHVHFEVRFHGKPIDPAPLLH